MSLPDETRKELIQRNRELLAALEKRAAQAALTIVAEPIKRYVSSFSITFSLLLSLLQYFFRSSKQEEGVESGSGSRFWKRYDLFSRLKYFPPVKYLFLLLRSRRS